MIANINFSRGGDLIIVKNKFNILWLVAISSILLLIGCAETEDVIKVEEESIETEYTIAEKGGKFGYVDESGEFVIKPKFRRGASKFSEGLAWVRDAEKDIPGDGYIDKTGEYVIEPQFLRASNFNEGLAAVQCYDTFNEGYIDKSGEFVIDPKFYLAFDFNNDIAKVHVEGRREFERTMSSVLTDSEFEATQIERVFKEGFIDTSGDYILEPKLDDERTLMERLEFWYVESFQYRN